MYVCMSSILHHQKKRHTPCHELEHSSFPRPKKRRWPWSQVGDFEGLRVPLGAMEAVVAMQIMEKWDRIVGHLENRGETSSN